MAERSKRIMLYDKDKIEKINEETKKLMKKYEIDMSFVTKKFYIKEDRKRISKLKDEFTI